MMDSPSPAIGGVCDQCSLGVSVVSSQVAFSPEPLRNRPGVDRSASLNEGHSSVEGLYPCVNVVLWVNGFRSLF